MLTLEHSFAAVLASFRFDIIVIYAHYSPAAGAITFVSFALSPEAAGDGGGDGQLLLFPPIRGDKHKWDKDQFGKSNIKND